MVTVKDRQFDIFIAEEEIKQKVAALAKRIEQDYKGRNPLFVGILNGAFIFAADLLREIDIDAEIQFTRVSSYEGTDTTGKVHTLLGLNADIRGRELIIVEDIVDTGITMASLVPQLKEQGAASVEIACLLTKPGKLQVPLDIKYCAMEIPNEFIVGYGLDYDGHGRNLKDIYVIKD